MPANRRGIIYDLITSHVSPVRSYTPRWVRENKRFNNPNLRSRVILGDLDVVTMFMMEMQKDVVDIRRSIDYTNRVIDKQFDYLRTKGDNK